MAVKVRWSQFASVSTKSEHIKLYFNFQADAKKPPSQVCRQIFLSVASAICQHNYVHKGFTIYIYASEYYNNDRFKNFI